MGVFDWQLYLFDRKCLELLSQLQVEDEDTLLKELQQLRQEEETLIQDLEAIEQQRESVAMEITEARRHAQQLDTEELQWVTLTHLLKN